MPTRRSTFRSFLHGLWLTGPRENVPDQGLRRAKGVFPLRGGSVLSRSPMTLICDRDAHSLFRFNNARFAGVGQQIYRDCALQTAPTQNGSPLSWMEIPAQFLATQPLRSKITDELFIAGGGAPIKIRSSDYKAENWGIFPPKKSMIDNIDPSVVVNPSTTTQIESFDNDNGGVVKYVIPENTDVQTDISANPLGSPPDINLAVRRLEGTHSYNFQGKKGQHLVMRKIPSGAIGPGVIDLETGSTIDDYITFFIRTNRPKHLQNIEIKLYVGGAGTFVPSAPGNDFYTREIQVQRLTRKQRKTQRALGDLIPDQQASQFLKNNTANTRTDFNLTSYLDADYRTVGVTKHTWTPVTIPKKLFTPSGKAGTVGFTFANVIGLEVVMELNSLIGDTGGGNMWIDDMELQKGIGTKGDYLWTFTFRNDNTGARSNPPIDQDGNVITISRAGLDRNSITFGNLNAGNTFGASNIPGYPTSPDADPTVGGPPNGQVTHVEVWRNIGSGGLTFFYVGKFAIGTASFLDDVSDYIGMHSKSDANFLDGSQQLTLDNNPLGVAFRDNYLSFVASPPNFNPAVAQNTADFIRQAVYHQPTGRVFALSNDFPGRLMYSAPGRPESLASFIEPSTPDDPLQRLVTWSNNLYVFTSKHIFEIVNVDEPFVPIEIYGAPGTTQPFTCRPSPMGIIYFAKDGARVFDGQVSRLLGEDQLAPIFRGSTVDTVNAPFVATVAEYGRSEAFFSDAATTTYTFDFRTAAWRNVGTAAKAFFYEHDTGVLQASAIGCVISTGQFLAAGSMSITTPAPSYFAPAPPLPTDTLLTLPSTQVAMARNITITGLTVHLSSALGAGHTLTFLFNVNGAPRVAPTEVILTMTTGDQIKSATGLTSVLANDLVAIELFTSVFAGQAVKSFAVTYTVEG